MILVNGCEEFCADCSYFKNAASCLDCGYNRHAVDGKCVCDTTSTVVGDPCYVACATDCKSCTNEVCLKCPAGSTDSSCTVQPTCNDGYYLDVSANTCNLCTSPCTKCTATGNTACLTCAVGSYLSNGSCLTCTSMSNCTECSNATTCTKCLDTYRIESGLCTNCATSCLTCSS
jgi:hypothetical protein